MILGSSDFTGKFIIVDGATAPLISIAAGADLAAISLGKAGDKAGLLNKTVLTLTNALPVVTGNLTLFAGAAGYATRDVRSLNAELAKTIGLMSGLSVVSSTGAPLIGGGGGSTARIGTGRRGRRPAWDVDVGTGELLSRGKDATFRGSDRVLGTPRFTRTGALGYYKEHPYIRHLGTGKIGALLNHPEIETQRNIARKMAADISFTEADKIIRRGYTDNWWEKHRYNALLSKPVKRLVPVKTVSKKDILGSPVTPYYVKEAIENAVFREMDSNKVPDAGGTFRDVQKYFDSVGAGDFTRPDEDILKKRYARNGAIMRRISSVVDEYTGKKGAYSTYNPYLNQRLFKAFTGSEEGLKLSRLERNMLDTLRGDKKLLRKFSGPTSGISWRIGKDRGFRINDLAIMSGIPTHEMAKMSDMLTPQEFDDWVTKQYYLRNPLGLTKTKAMKTTWRTGDREMIYPVRNWQRSVIKSLSKSQLVELTNIKKGKWTEDALSKESFRRIRKGIPLHFDTLFDKHPDLLPETELLSGRSTPFVSDRGMDASLRRAIGRTSYRQTLRQNIIRQGLPKTVSHWRANAMETAVNSLIADFDKYGSYPSDLEITKRHDRSFMREKIRKGLIRTQFWDVARMKEFDGRTITKLRGGRLPTGDNFVDKYYKPMSKEMYPFISYKQKSLLAPRRAQAAYYASFERTRKKRLSAPVDPFKQFEESITRLRIKHTPGSIRRGLFEDAFTDLGFTFNEASLASRKVENRFKGMGNRAVSTRRVTRAFSDTLHKMGASTNTVSMGTHLLGRQIKHLDSPLRKAAFRTSLFNNRLWGLSRGFNRAGGSARNFGILSALALNEPVLFMGAMLGMMPPLIGGFAALASAALGLAGAFVLLGLGGAMVWGDKLKNNTDRVSDLNKELGVTGTKASGSIGKASYTVKGLTADIGGLALVMNEFKKEIGPVFKEFGKPWVLFMETMPASIAGGFRKIFTAITPFSEMIQIDASAVGGWFTNLISGFLKYSLGLLRDPEIRSSFRTIMDAIPKYGKRGMDFIVNAFLENKGTIKDFLKSMIELLPPFLTAMTSFFRTIVPVITFVVKQFKNLVKVLGGGDAKRGANLFGLVLGGLAFAGILSKTIGFVVKLVDKFGKLREIIRIIRLEQTGAGILGGAGAGLPGGAGKGGPVIIPPKTNIPKGTGSRLPSVITGAGGILTRLAPWALLALMGYVAVDAFQMKEQSRKAYETDPRYRANADRAYYWEQKNIANARLNLPRPPDISNLADAYNPSKKQAVQNLQDSIQRADINVNINADPQFVVKVNQAMSKDANIDSWVHYRAG